MTMTNDGSARGYVMFIVYTCKIREKQAEIFRKFHRKFRYYIEPDLSLTDEECYHHCIT